MSKLDVAKIKKHVKLMEHRANQFIFFDNESLSITIKDSDGNTIKYFDPSDTPTLIPMLKNMLSDMQLTMGPRASGKSVVSCSKILWIVKNNPACIDGVKRARWIIARNTYGELKTTTIKTFEYWFGQRELEFSIRYDSPITAKLKYFDGESPTELEIIFVSFDDAAAAKKALSLEASGAYFNEGSKIPTSAIEAIKGSLGRYPPKIDLPIGAVYFSPILIDSNSFEEYHPFYSPFISNPAIGHAFYRQPGAYLETHDGKFVKNPEAENIKNLPPNYYEKMISGSSISYIRTQICNQFGTHEENKPVHPEFKKSIHSTDNIPLDESSPLWLLHDYGGTNATLVCQYVRGQLRCIKELIDCKDGLRQFMSKTVTNWLIDNAPDIRVSISAGDPSDNYSHETAQSSSAIVTSSLGISTRGAVTNSIKRRIDAVDELLLKSYAGGKSGLIISREGCPVLYSAMCGKYQLQLVKSSDMIVEKPIKNEWSHVADCLQYAALEVKKITDTRDLSQIEKSRVVEKMRW